MRPRQAQTFQEHRPVVPRGSAVAAAVVFTSVGVFFALEMLLKPISGEDAYQKHCMPDGWASSGECADFILGFVPRLGQVFHYMVIWLFGSTPQFGYETIIRLGDAAASFGIIWMVFVLAAGRRPRLRPQDSIVFALVFLLAVLSPINQVFFNGFSNVHNYVPVMVSTLVGVYGLVAYRSLQRTFGRRFAPVVVTAAFFVTTAGFDVNSLAVPLTLAVVAMLRRWRRNAEWDEPVPWVPAGFGWLSGVWFFWVLGDGMGSLTARSDIEYRGGLSITEGLESPWTLIVSLTGNTVSNVTEYAPYLFITCIAVFLGYRCTETSDLQRRTLAVAPIFGLFYLAGLAPLTNAILNRISAPAFALFLAPLAFLALHAIDRVNERWSVRTGWLVAALVLAILGDNTRTLLTNLERTGHAIDRITAEGCVTKEVVNSAGVLDESRVFRVARSETPFSHVFSDWYFPYFDVNGQQIPIADHCNSE